MRGHPHRKQFLFSSLETDSVQRTRGSPRGVSLQVPMGQTGRVWLGPTRRMELALEAATLLSADDVKTEDVWDLKEMPANEKQIQTL